MPEGRRRHKRDSKADKKGRALQPAQAQMLLAECDADAENEREADPELKLVILLGLLAGLRRGEIFALQFSEIDWEKDLIHVRRNLFWRYGKHHELTEDQPSFVIYTPKSDKSMRDVDLSPTLKDVLWSRYMEMQMEGKTGLIFQTKAGTPLDPKNVYNRSFRPAVERARKKAEKNEDKAAMQAFDGLRLHDLRHTFGSWKVAQGEDIIYVAAQMGHARPSITADIYSHLLEKRRPHAAAKTDDFLFGNVAVAEVAFPQRGTGHGPSSSASVIIHHIYLTFFGVRLVPHFGHTGRSSAKTLFQSADPSTWKEPPFRPSSE